MKSMTISTPIGAITFMTQDEVIRRVSFGGDAVSTPKDSFEEEVVQQLKDFFARKRKCFDLPFELEGTDFQKKVWRALEKIPYGETRSYQALAQQLKTGARAVGNACGANPCVILIPCHRVVATSGLGGFTGGLSRKQWLLDHEGIRAKG